MMKRPLFDVGFSVLLTTAAVLYLGKKALLLVKGAGHARSIVCARAEYTRTLYTFLDEFAGGPA